LVRHKLRGGGPSKKAQKSLLIKVTFTSYNPVKTNCRSERPHKDQKKKGGPRQKGGGNGRRCGKKKWGEQEDNGSRVVQEKK